jgi:dipeptidyl aminopeptidase/acylaminoacyl peptidase
MKPLHLTIVVRLLALGSFAYLPAAFAQSKDPAAPEKAADKPTMELNDLDKLVRPSDPQISPDGKSIVVVVSRANLEKDKYVSELNLVDIATQETRVLTRERDMVTQPRWSPKGDRLAFIGMRGSGEKAHPQILIMPMNGGDAAALTDAPHGVQHYAWSPDGKHIAYATEDEPANKKEIDKHNDGFEVGDNDFLTTAAPQPTHVWLIESAGGKARRLTSGSWSLPTVPPPGSPSSPLSWSPDGKSLAIVRQAQPHFGDSDFCSVQILDVATGSLRPLTGKTMFESVPAFSPDGTRVSYWYPRDADPNNVNEICVAPAAGGEGNCISRPLDRCLYRSIWMPDSRSILTGANDHTRVRLWLQPLEGPARQLDLGQVNPSWSFWIDVNTGPYGAIAFTGSEPNRPSELYYLASVNDRPRRLTNFNHAIAGKTLGKVESIEWQGPDGFNEDGVLIYPPNFNGNKKLPLVLLIHGGPQAASTESFAAFGQIMAAHGYLVFSPNYRGSDNLGNSYQRAIVNDAGAGPGRDVMAGIEAVKKKGIVDETRIGVTGWSYGGYMTSWLIGHYQIWKAAMAGAAVTDWDDQYNLADFNVTARYSFGGSPWTADFAKAYREQSPIHYARQIRTPTLILSTTGDARVPVTQSYRLYHALKDNGVKTKFIAWPVPGHFPSDPVRAKDVYSRWVGWMDEYLR